MQSQGRPDRGVAESKPQDEVAVEPLAGDTVESAGSRRTARRRRVQAAPNVSHRRIAVVQIDGQAEAYRVGKPASSTGGVIREASGTASVSAAVPPPTGGPGNGVPGM